MNRSLKSFPALFVFVQAALCASCDKAPMAPPAPPPVVRGVAPVSTSPVILAAGDGMFGTEMAIGSNDTLYTERHVNGSRLVDARKLDGEKLWTANVACSSDRCPISVDGGSNALIGTGNWTSPGVEGIVTGSVENANVFLQTQALSNCQCTSSWSFAGTLSGDKISGNAVNIRSGSMNGTFSATLRH